jgi:hypothetical protein
MVEAVQRFDILLNPRQMMSVISAGVLLFRWISHDNAPPFEDNFPKWNCWRRRHVARYAHREFAALERTGTAVVDADLPQTVVALINFEVRNRHRSRFRRRLIEHPVKCGLRNLDKAADPDCGDIAPLGRLV